MDEKYKKFLSDFLVDPVMVFPITCNSNDGLQQFQGIFIMISIPGPFGPGWSV